MGNIITSIQHNVIQLFKQVDKVIVVIVQLSFLRSPDKIIIFNFKEMMYHFS